MRTTLGLLAALACAAAARAVADSPVLSILPEPLTAMSFRPFGQVVEAPADMKPTLENAVLSYWGGLAKMRFHEDMEFGLFTVRAREHEVAEMERHMKTPELLVGLTGDFILVVAPHAVPKAGVAHPDPAKVKAFLVPRGKALLLAKGTWHALPFPKDPTADFLVGFRNGTAKKDQTLRPFRQRDVVTF